MKESVKGIVMWMIVCVITVSMYSNSEAGKVLTSVQTEEYLNTISKQLMSTYPNPKYATSGGEWAVISLARYGYIDQQYIDTYKKNLAATLKQCKGRLSERKYTEYSRVVIALAAIGENPENFQGYNLVEPLYDIEKVKLQGINGVAYALIAMNSGNYDNPKDETGMTVTDRLREEILQAQLSEGGFSMSGKNPDADVTAIAIQALAAYVESHKESKEAVEAGLNILSKLQCESGGYTAYGTEACESIAQVLVALSEIRISPEDERFVKNGNTVLDALMTYYRDGGFSHVVGKNKNAIATEQGMYALVSYHRSINGKNRLYDMSDGLVYKKVENVSYENSKVDGGNGIKEQTETVMGQDKEESVVKEKQTKSGKEKVQNKKKVKSGNKKNDKANKEDSDKDKNGDDIEKGIDKKTISDQSLVDDERTAKNRNNEENTEKNKDVEDKYNGRDDKNSDIKENENSEDENIDIKNNESNKEENTDNETGTEMGAEESLADMGENGSVEKFTQKNKSSVIGPGNLGNGRVLVVLLVVVSVISGMYIWKKRVNHEK